MEKGKITLTQKDAENTPAGGVVVGKRDGQTMIYDDASLGGYFVGKLHKDGGIKMVNKSTGQPLEVQGAEVIITAPAVNDQTKREFEGKMMTNREILSKINSDGGGVSFADGGDIPAKIHTTDCEYKFGGKVVKDTDIAHSLGMNSTLKKGKQQFSSGDTTYDVDAIYNAIKKGKLRLKTKEVETFPMKYPVYDKNYAENHKIDFRKPNGITVRTESGEEVLIDGNHRMNNAYSKGRKTMKTYYIEDPKQIAKFTKKNKFMIGGYNAKTISDFENPKEAIEYVDKEIVGKAVGIYTGGKFKEGGHLSKGKSLKQIAEMHNVTLTHINEELAKGLEVEKEHFADFKERTRVAKDHLVENPNYYTILEKAGLKRGGHLQKQELVEKSKKGDTPARDLNNYNDVLDLEADGMVGMESGLAFANGGDISKIKRYSPFPNSMDINENGDWVMYNEVKDLASFSETDKYAYVGNGRMMQSPYGDWVLYRKMSYADGGIAPIDANIEGDSVDIVESDFAKGGVVYDTTKPKIEKITIKDTKFNRTSVIGRNATTVSEFQQIVSDYIGNTPKEDVDWINFYVNDSTRGSYYIDLNKGKKNTVKNVNPETLNSLNFRRVIDAKTYLVKNYDWTDFFELGSQKSAFINKKENSPDLVRLEYSLQGNKISRSFRTGDDLLKEFFKIEEYCVKNPDESVTIEITAEVVDSTGRITATERNVTFGEKHFKPRNWTNAGIENLMTKDWFSDKLDFTDFFKSTSNTSTSAQPLNLSKTKVWLGEDYKQSLELSKKIQEKAFELGWGWFINGKDKKVKDDIQAQAFYFNDKNEMTYSSGISGREYFDKNEDKELTPEEILSITTPTSSQSTNASTSTKPFDFSMTKIDVSYNPELSVKVQKKAFEDGWEWENGGGKTIDYNTFNYLYFTKTSISYGNSNSSFSNSPKREITEAEIFGNQSSNLAPFEASQVTLEWRNNLGILVYRNFFTKDLVKYGLSFSKDKSGQEFIDELKNIEKERNDKDVEVTIRAYAQDNDGNDFEKNDYFTIGENFFKPSTRTNEQIKSVVEEWIDGINFDKFFEEVIPLSGNQALTTVKKPVVYQIKIYTTEKNSGTSSVSVARSFEDFFRIIKKLVVTKDEFVDTINLSIFSDDPNIKYSDLSFAVEEQTFDLLTDDEAKENLMDSLSANNQELDFKEFFSKSKVKNVDYVIVKEPRSFPDGQKVYRGSAILPLLKDIYKNSPIEHTKVEIDLVVNGQAEDAPLTLTLTGVPTYSDYEINPNDINEQILYGKLKLDWFPEYQWDRLFPLIELLDFYLEDSYLPNYTTKNINELFSKLNAPEVKSSNKQITLTWFGENGETHKFGAYFTGTVSGYYQIDRNNFSLDVLREKLDEWFYGRLSDSYMFPNGKVNTKTPTSNSVVPKTVENNVYNLDLAIQKLEKASSSVVTEYNKDIYDQSLKFLYDTKASYELALKFTPESAFMYERLDILKKLADIEKKIKNIEDMKKGGTFYMLAKILEKLERGENWKMLEQSQDVITNQIPQSEIDVIIRSQKFKNWFGDWEKALINDEYDNVSKALTNGIPSVYHHGARRIKYTYREVSNGVLYLAENISYAVWFSQNATAQSEEGNYLTECFVNIKNPIDLTAFHVKKVDLGDIVRYVDAVYPLAKIYDFIPAQVALLIKTNQPTNVRMWAWQLIRSYAKFVNHIKENTPYDGFLYYENNPSDEVINPVTGQLEENVTKAVAIFKSHQVKVVDAVLFDGGLDDWRFENGGKIKN